MTPSTATDVGSSKAEDGRSYTRFRLSPGWAYKLQAGEWRESTVTPGDVSSCKDTDKILMIKGRACVVFSVLGTDQLAQPITGAVTPAVQRVERIAKLAKTKRADPPSVSKDAPSVEKPQVGCSKASLKLAKMRERGGHRDP
jgi:hypothetical protein